MPTDEAFDGIGRDWCEGIEIFRIFRCAIAAPGVTAHRQRTIRLPNGSLAMCRHTGCCNCAPEYPENLDALAPIASYAIKSFISRHRLRSMRAEDLNRY